MKIFKENNFCIVIDFYSDLEIPNNYNVYVKKSL